MKTGDRVVCVATLRWQGVKLTTKGQIYDVSGVWECPRCGTIGLDVGVAVLNNWGTLERCNCGHTWNTNIYYIHSKYFRPLQFNSAHDELINIVEERIDTEQPAHAL